MSDEEQKYEYIHAIVDCDKLMWRYKLVGNEIAGKESFDEDVSDYSEQDIVNLTMSMLMVDEDQRGLIEVQYR